MGLVSHGHWEATHAGEFVPQKEVGAVGRRPCAGPRWAPGGVDIAQHVRPGRDDRGHHQHLVHFLAVLPALPRPTSHRVIVEVLLVLLPMSVRTGYGPGPSRTQRRTGDRLLEDSAEEPESTAWAQGLLGMARGSKLGRRGSGH